MPALVPSDQAELRATDALPRAFGHDVLHAVERDHGLHRRLVARNLVRDRTRHGLPRLADAHLGRADGIIELWMLLRALGDRTTRAARKLVLAICARHARVVRVRALKETIFDRDVLVRQAGLLVEGMIGRVDAVLHLHVQREAPRTARGDGDPCGARRLHAEHGHQQVRRLATVRTRDARESPQLPSRKYEVAVLALPRGREIRRHDHANGVGGNLRRRPTERGHAVHTRERNHLRLARAA